MRYPNRDPWLDEIVEVTGGPRITSIDGNMLTITHDPTPPTTRGALIEMGWTVGPFSQQNGVLYAHGMLLDPTDSEIVW